MTLYIFGNGFDINHGLKTSYQDYHQFVLDNLNKHKDWDIILDFYPNSYEFWSDVETNVCKINPNSFIQLKTIYKMSFLDDLFYRIKESFREFIINASKKEIPKKFTFDEDAVFINFNYTTYLEDVYGIKRGRIFYLHNDLEGPILKKYFGIYSSDDLIVGHSPVHTDYFFYKDSMIGGDKEYIEYRNNTVKPCQKIIKEKGLDRFLIYNNFKIDKIVFFGFSFSKADKQYLELLFLYLPPSLKQYVVYYHNDNGKTDFETIEELKNRIHYAGGATENMTFINCEGVNKI